MPKPTRPPTARLRRLASELAALREQAGLNREEVLERTGINPATLYKIEKAQARPQGRTLKALLDLYEVDQAKRDALTSLQRNAGQQTWVQPYAEDLPVELNTLMGFEVEATAFWTYQQTNIPGLLQTEAHARTLIRGMLPDATDDEVERRVEIRMQRQTNLANLNLWAIVDEAAFHRQIGTRSDWQAQLNHLQELLQRPGLTLQVVPYDAGPHPAMLGSFVILKFGDPALTDIVYLEGLTSDLFLDDQASVARYLETFEHLRAQAASPIQTNTFLAEVAREL